MSTPHSHDFGSVGDEAAKLLDAVQDWARSTFGEGESARMATGAAECEWCPLCQLVAVLRGERPETTEKVVAAGSAIVTALRALLEPVDPRGAPDPAGAPKPAARVQRIDLTGEG